NQIYNLTSVENVTFDDHDWIVTQRFQTGPSVSLNIDATALSGGHTLTFDGTDSDGPTTANASFVFEFAGNFISGDSLTGSNNNDTLSLNGDYSGGTTFGAAQLTSIEAITLADGHTYSLTTNDANVASGATLTVDASALTGANQLFFNGSAETDGHFAFIGGAGDDDLEGGAQSDTFDLSRSDGAFVYGNGGNDSFTVTSAAHLLDDSIDGGAGSDTLILDGDFSTQTAITASNVVNIETLQLLGASNSYNLVLGGGIAGAATLTIDASAASSLTLDVSGAPSTTYDITGSAGDDVINMGAALTAADQIDGGGGGNVVTLDGDYSAGLTLGPTTLVNFVGLILDGGHSYTLTTDDATVASGNEMTIDASALGAGDTLIFDGSAETDGNFAFEFGAGFTASDQLTGNSNGGGYNDSLGLDGDYTGAHALVLTATTLQDIGSIAVNAGHSYDITINNATVAAHTQMVVDAQALGAGDTLTFDGAAETKTSSSFYLYDGAGDDSLTGGAGADVISITNGGNDTVNGGGGDDTIYADDTLTAADHIDGGNGNDALYLDGDYSGAHALVFTATTLLNIGYVSLAGGQSYDITTNDATVATNGSMTVDASALGAGDTLTFNGSAETDGHFSITGGAGNDTITGGAQSDTIDVSAGGNDTVTGGGGGDTITASASSADTDTFVYNAVSDSTGANFDTISNVHWAGDLFHISGFATDPTAIDTAVTTGSLSQATFNSDLASDIGAGQLGAHHAVLFTPSSGTYGGDTFLIVDVNGTAGYQANQDLVIEIGSSSGTLTTASFS
ncbi:MAG TPA: bluetail domain-containing putative surface protein, partial [Rhizomicrobium sp.]|nr:bluetail domain-containing putative surface protein [Rhizomicrobium sp.]